jgi:acyl carrier protein
MAASVADRIREALGKELKKDVATIQLHHALRQDLGLNSLDAIELMFKVEEDFDIAIPDADLQQLVTVGNLVSYIEGRLAGVPASTTPPTPPAPKPVQAKPKQGAKTLPAKRSPAVTKKVAPARTKAKATPARALKKSSPIKTAKKAKATKPKSRGTRG